MNKVKSIDEFISSYPAEIQAGLQQMRRTIQKAAQKAAKKISYRNPIFYLKGLVGAAAKYQAQIGDILPGV